MNDKIIENRHCIVVESAALKVDVAIRRKSKSKLAHKWYQYGTFINEQPENRTLLEVLTEF